MSRLEKLKELEAKLYVVMESADDRSMASLARQYRETIREIEEIEGAEDNGDEITKILSGREAAGKSKAVRKSRAAVSQKRRK